MTDHDFKTPIEVTGTKLCYIILDELNKNKEMLIPADLQTTRTPEEQSAFEKAQDEKATDFAISILKMIASTDMPADYAGYPIEKLLAVLTQLKMYVEGSVRQSQDEIMSRYLGAKSPLSGKYRKDCATFADIVMKLEEVRQATGGNDEDYFTSTSVTTK